MIFPEAALYCMRCDVIDSTVGVYTGDLERAEGLFQNGGFWTFIPRPKLERRTHGDY